MVNTSGLLRTNIDAFILVNEIKEGIKNSFKSQ